MPTDAIGPSQSRVIVSNNSNCYAMEKLMGSENWATWSFDIRTRLDLDDLWVCIEETTSDAVKEKNAKGKLILSVDKQLYVHIETANTAKEIWTRLKSLFQDSGLDRRIGLLQKLCSIQLAECKSVEEYVGEIVSTANKLTNIGFKVGDEWVASLLLKGLPEEYKPMIMAIDSSSAPFTADRIKMKILQDVKLDKGASKNSALVSSKFKKFKPKNKSIF